MVTKGDLMELTGNNHAVDSAIPEPWAQKMREMGIENPSWWYA